MFGAPALAARALWPDADITWFHLDAYVGRKVEGVLATNLVEDVRVDVDELWQPGRVWPRPWAPPALAWAPAWALLPL